MKIFHFLCKSNRKFAAFLCLGQLGHDEKEGALSRRKENKLHSGGDGLPGPGQRVPDKPECLGLGEPMGGELKGGQLLPGEEEGCPAAGLGKVHKSLLGN